MLAFVLLRGGGNWRTRGKPPTLDGQALPCHMQTPVFEIGAATVTSEGLPLRYPYRYIRLGLNTTLTPTSLISSDWSQRGSS